jgi:hypothetical protein
VALARTRHIAIDACLKITTPKPQRNRILGQSQSRLSHGIEGLGRRASRFVDLRSTPGRQARSIKPAAQLNCWSPCSGELIWGIARDRLSQRLYRSREIMGSFIFAPVRRQRPPVLAVAPEASLAERQCWGPILVYSDLRLTDRRVDPTAMRHSSDSSARARSRCPRGWTSSAGVLFKAGSWTYSQGPDRTASAP